MNGQIKSIRVKEGQQVKKGTLLAVLDTEVLQSQLQELKTKLNQKMYILFVYPHTL